MNTLKENYDKLLQENARLVAERENYRLSYESIYNSTIWKASTPLRRMMEAIRSLFRKESPISYREPAFFPPPSVKASQLVDDPIHPLPMRKVATKAPRLNVIVDSIDKNNLFGGVSTALILATKFCHRYDYTLRIITRRTPVIPSEYTDIMFLQGIEPVAHVEYFSDSAGDSHLTLDIGKNDVFFATSWWSAYSIEKSLPGQRYFYIIQDVEYMFYPAGVQQVLCNEIMASKHPFFIVNSKYLWDYFTLHNPNIAQNGTWFDPAFSTKLYSKPDFCANGKRKLLFYARPDNPRNLYSIGLQVLNLAALQGVIDPNRWDISFMGQDVPQPVIFDSDLPVNYLGRLDWNEYGKKLHRSDVVLSLMCTPHPSYPPYDAASSGCVVVSNQYENKTDFPASKNVILCPLDIQSLVDGLAKAISIAENADLRQANFESQTILRDWDTALDQSLTEMKKVL